MKNDTKKILCIRCPKGCELKVTEKNGEIEVSGNECRLGREYAREEMLNPQRIVTSTVRIHNASYPRLPVRTNKTVPKDKIDMVIEKLQNLSVEAPVEYHDVILKNVLDTKVDVISERDMERVKK